MKHHNIWVGMDVHADEIHIAVYWGQELTPREEFMVVPDDAGLKRLVSKLKALHGEIRCVYEAGPCGYQMQRFLSLKGIHCDVVAPSLIPKRSGDRVKTDRRDAKKLGRLYRAGELTSVVIPSEAQEAVRDLVRIREDAQENVVRSRHRLIKFLLRHGYRYREGKAWTTRHRKWLAGVKMQLVPAQTVLHEYRIALDQAEDQLQRIKGLVEQTAEDKGYKGTVDRLKTLRGFQTITAMTVAAEVGDLRRFGSAPEFMAATGLVSSQYSSGSKEHRGSITKSGNVHIRKVLVEAAWHYRHPAIVSKALRERRKGQPAEVVAIAQKAAVRLNRKYWRMLNKGKRSTVAVVAVARELAGFVWALGQAA